MYAGNYKIALDEKGRMRIPNKLRAKLDGEVLLFAGTNGCLFLMTAKEFDENISSKVKDIPLSDFEKQNEIRRIASTLQEIEEDNQGRFVLQPNLKRHAHINKKVVFLGALNRIEIWSEEQYAAQFIEGDGVDIDKSVKTLEV